MQLALEAACLKLVIFVFLTVPVIRAILFLLWPTLFALAENIAGFPVAMTGADYYMYRLFGQNDG